MAAENPHRHGENGASSVPLGFPLGLEITEIAPGLLAEGVTFLPVACGPCRFDGYKTCYFIICNAELKMCWIVSGENQCRTPIDAMVHPTPTDAGPQ